MMTTANGVQMDRWPADGFSNCQAAEAGHISGGNGKALKRKLDIYFSIVRAPTIIILTLI